MLETSYDGFKLYMRGEYINIRVDRKYGYPLHRYVWQKANGIIPTRMIIHHMDGDPLNNDISNLECLSYKDHTRTHNGWLRGADGDWVSKPCNKCGAIKELKAFYKKGTLGRSAHCKECQRASVATYIAENPEKHSAAVKRYWKNNKGTINANARKRYKKDM